MQSQKLVRSLIVVSSVAATLAHAAPADTRTSDGVFAAQCSGVFAVAKQVTDDLGKPELSVSMYDAGYAFFVYASGRIDPEEAGAISQRTIDELSPRYAPKNPVFVTQVQTRMETCATWANSKLKRASK